MKTTLNKIYIYAMLTVFTLIAITPAHGVVLCFGIDGHVALEYAAGDSCSDNEAARNPSNANALSISNDSCDQCCYDCVDFRMVNLEDPLIQQKDQPVSTSLASASFQIFTCPTGHNTAPSAEDPVSSRPTTTVVLRI